MGADQASIGGVRLPHLSGKQELYPVTPESFQGNLLSDRSPTNLKLERSSTSSSFDNFSHDRDHLLGRRSNIPELRAGKLLDDHANYKKHVHDRSADQLTGIHKNKSLVSATEHDSENANDLLTHTLSVLPGKVRSATSGARGFDTSSKLSLTRAKKFHAQGYKYAIRYVSLGSFESSDDLTTKEAAGILEAGLALMPVQHVLAGKKVGDKNVGWTPSGSLGTRFGKNAAQHAAEIGFPKGVNLWMDLENVSSSTATKSVIDYANNWYNAVSRAGYTPGIYVGFNSKLTSSQLYNDLNFQHYWKSGSIVPDVAVRGYQMVQHPPLDTYANGIKIDKDTIAADKKGGNPEWLIA
jgi:hypothetical protein